MTEIDNKRTVKSDETLIGILDVLGQHDGIRLTKIANELDLANSTVYNHLITLQKSRFVYRNDGNYYLGLKLLEFGNIAQQHRELFRVGKNYINNLANETDEKVWFVVEENGLAVYLYGAGGARSIKTFAREGKHTELHHLASGKAILAEFSDKQVNQIIDQHGLPSYAENTITSKKKLLEELDQVRAQGVAFNLQETVKDLNAIGSSIVGDSGVHGAIAISGPANRLTKRRLENELADMLLGLTNELEINIRYEHHSL